MTPLLLFEYVVAVITGLGVGAIIVLLVLAACTRGDP